MHHENWKDLGLRVQLLRNGLKSHWYQALLDGVLRHLEDDNLNEFQAMLLLSRPRIRNILNPVYVQPNRDLLLVEPARRRRLQVFSRLVDPHGRFYTLAHNLIPVHIRLHMAHLRGG